MKINTERLVLVFIIALLIVYIVALIFYYTGREDITKEIARVLRMLFEFVFIPVAVISFTLGILTLLKLFREA